MNTHAFVVHRVVSVLYGGNWCSNASQVGVIAVEPRLCKLLTPTARFPHRYWIFQLSSPWLSTELEQEAFYAGRGSPVSLWGCPASLSLYVTPGVILRPPQRSISVVR